MNSYSTVNKSKWKHYKKSPYQFCIWIKEARLARRELAELYRVKEKYDEKRTHIKGIVHRLRSVV